MDTMKHELLNKFQAIIDDKLSKLQSIPSNTEKLAENTS